MLPITKERHVPRKAVPPRRSIIQLDGYMVMPDHDGGAVDAIRILLVTRLLRAIVSLFDSLEETGTYDAGPSYGDGNNHGECRPTFEDGA